MAKTVRRTISGARVNFDPRTTAEAHYGRDPRNYKAEQQPRRRKAWEARQSSKQDN